MRWQNYKFLKSYVDFKLKLLVAILII